MDLAFIDFLATRGHRGWHLASPAAKLLFTVVTVVAVIIAGQLLSLALILALLLVMMTAARLPVTRLLHFLAYPAFFGGIFAASHVGGGWVQPVMLVLKAVTVAAGGLLLVATTPMVDIFAHLRLVLPPAVVEAMFFTYRSFFLLLGRLQDLHAALRLRGGYTTFRLVANVRNVAAPLGVLLITAMDTGERMHRVLVLRGYRQGCGLPGRLAPFSSWDWVPCLAGAGILLAAVML